MIAEKKYDEAIRARGFCFTELLLTMKVVLQQTAPQVPKKYNIAVVNAGASAPGMNSAVRVLVRFGIGNGYTVFGVKNGFEGLSKGELEEMTWSSVSGWGSFGGSNLGTNRTVPDSKAAESIAFHLKKHNIQALVMVGGFEGYRAFQVLTQNRDKFPALQIPFIAIPATVSNNTPATDISIGADKALNNMVEATDNIKQSAIGYARRIFVVEVLGARCGFLALMGGIIAGAEGVYMHEEGITLNTLTKELKRITNRFNDPQSGPSVSLYITNESASSLYSTHFMASLFEKETTSDINVRTSVLGHLQQGGNPTPLDRILASRLAYHAINYLLKFPSTTKPQDIAGIALGLRGAEIVSSPLAEVLEKEMDYENRRPKDQWWYSYLRPIQDGLSFNKAI